VNGLYAGTQTSNTADHGFDARVPVGTTLTLTYTVTNNTGAALSGLTIKFNEEQYQDATATPNNINLLSDNGGGAFSQANLTGDINNNELQSGGTTTVYATPLTAARTASYNQSIPNGGSVQFQFAFVPGGGGNRPIFGIDDLQVTANVPEPASFGFLLTGAAIGILGRRRRA